MAPAPPVVIEGFIRETVCRGAHITIIILRDSVAEMQVARFVVSGYDNDGVRSAICPSQSRFYTQIEGKEFFYHVIDIVVMPAVVDVRAFRHQDEAVRILRQEI